MKKATILIVEDDENIRTLYKDAFELQEMTVLTGENGQEGVRLALEHHPDVILMDIMMPIMDGHQAMQRIRLDEWGRNAKVIFLTNFSDAENVVHAVEEGTEEYIVKANTSIKDMVNQVCLVMDM